MTAGLIVFGLFVLWCIVIGILSERLPFNRRVIQYWRRPCAGRAWRRAFPDASKQHIREFLSCFACDAFGFPKRIALHFRPDDKIMDVYRAFYPAKGRFRVDGMELETFALDLQDFSIAAEELEAAWHEDITLGEVFRMTLEPAK